MSTVTPPVPPQLPDPGHNGWIEFAKWCLSDHRRTAWLFAALALVLVAGVTTAAFLAPYLGDFGGALGGTAVGGGLTLGGRALVRRRKCRDEDDEE